MKLLTNKEYVFMFPNGELVVQSSEVKTTPHKTIESQVWIDIQNYVESRKGKVKVSVDKFNQLKMKFISPL